MSNSLSTLHTNTKTDPIVVKVFTNQANVLISRADAVIMIPAHFFSAAQLLSCIYHDNLRHGNCRVPIVTTPSWFYQSPNWLQCQRIESSAASADDGSKKDTHRERNVVLSLILWTRTPPIKYSIRWN